MSTSVKSGTIALNTSTGNQAITGVGFQPKIVFFFPSGENTAAGTVNNQRMAFGVGVSASDRRAIGTYAQNGQTVAANGRNHTDTKCFEVMTANTVGTTTLYAADFVSQDADGFTFNLSTAPASAFKVGYLAIGGSDITNVKTGQYTSAIATGNQAVTGVGFKPDALFLFGINRATAPPNATTTGAFTLGFGKSATARAATSISSTNAATTATARGQKTTDVYASSDFGVEEDLVTLDADGFTVNVIAAPGAAIYEHYVAIKGIRLQVGSFNTATATGNFAVTGVGFKPIATIFMSKLNPASTASETDSRISLGIGVDSTNRFALSSFDQTGLTTSKSRHIWSESRIYTNYNNTPTLIEDLDFVSSDQDGFTINQVTTDATARQVVYFAIGSSPLSGNNQAMTMRQAVSRASFF